MESHHGCLLLLGMLSLQLTTTLVQCVPLPYSDRGKGLNFISVCALTWQCELKCAFGLLTDSKASEQIVW